MSPSASRSSVSARSLPRSRPVRIATRDAGLLGERRDGGEMLARQDFGRRHQRGLPAGLDHGRGGEQRHHGLAGADVALQQPQHALRLARDRRRCRRPRAPATASANRAAPRSPWRAAGLRRSCRGRAGGADARAPARARAGRRAIRHRRAATRPGSPGSTSAGSAGRCSAVQRVGERREVLLRCSQAASCHSGSVGQLRQRGFDRLAHLIERRGPRSADRPARPAAACRARPRSTTRSGCTICSMPS